MRDDFFPVMLIGVLAGMCLTVFFLTATDNLRTTEERHKVLLEAARQRVKDRARKRSET